MQKNKHETRLIRPPLSPIGVSLSLVLAKGQRRQQHRKTALAAAGRGFEGGGLEVVGVDQPIVLL